ncbi:MAG TPA: PEP-CTERM sorting domain-containing protein [Tepidisphaeraceae bacterium]|jgi:hypothetical protein
MQSKFTSRGVRRTALGLVVGAFVVAAGLAGQARAAIDVSSTFDLDKVGKQTLTSPDGLQRLDRVVLLGTAPVFTLSGVANVSSDNAFPAITANLVANNRFNFTVRAPEGQQYRLTLPAGTTGEIGFSIYYESQGAGNPSPQYNPNVSFAINGVPRPLTQVPGIINPTPYASVDPQAFSLMLGGRSALASSFTFQTLTMSLDYPAFSTLGGLGGGAVSVDRLYQVNSGGNVKSWVDVASQGPIAAGPLTLTLESVPEPASLALVALPAALALNRRRRPRA